MSRKEKIASISAIAFLLAAVAALVIILGTFKPAESPAPKVRHYELSAEYFDTVSWINEYKGADEAEFYEACAAVEAVFARYDALCDIYTEYSGIVNLKNVNDFAGTAVKVDAELFDVLEFAKEMHTLTEGSLNVAMGAVLKLWHEKREAADLNPFDDDDNALPSEAELTAAAEHCDINDLVLDRKNMTVTLLDPEMSIDLGAVAKGYAVERAAEVLSDMGLDGYVINAGGNIRAVGTNFGGEAWDVKIKDPSDPLSTAGSVKVADAAAVTSGGYERYFVVDGKKYHHIINEKTLMPSEFFASVTVVHESSAVADCLSTALFNSDAVLCEKIIKNIEEAGLGKPEVVYIDLGE